MPNPRDTRHARYEELLALHGKTDDRTARDEIIALTNTFLLLELVDAIDRLGTALSYGNITSHRRH